MERKRKKSKCNGNSNSQYGDLSTAAAKCAAFGRDDRDLGEVGESTAKATADSQREWEKRNKCDGKGRSGFPLGMEIEKQRQRQVVVRYGWERVELSGIEQ